MDKDGICDGTLLCIKYRCGLRGKFCDNSLSVVNQSATLHEKSQAVGKDCKQLHQK